MSNKKKGLVISEEDLNDDSDVKINPDEVSQEDIYTCIEYNDTSTI